MSENKPLTAKSSIGDWLKHPVGGPLLRNMLAQGGQNESALKPVRMLALQRLVSLSKGKLPQQVIDDLVARANGGAAPAQPDDESVVESADPDVPVRSGRDVVIVIGVGGMGEIIARRQGGGKRLLLADFSAQALERVAGTLRGEGFEVTVQPVDVSSRESVAALVSAASELGSVSQVIHTAGLSPAQAPVSAILAVDLVGVALVLEEFGAVIAAGGAGVVISSMAGHGIEIPEDVEQQLALSAVEDLTALPFITELTDPGSAYGIAKRANQLRVEVASTQWGARGARVNTISPGVISTSMGQLELSSDHGDVIRAMIESSGTHRIGTATDIADAAAFLLGSSATFITGADLLVDGGVVAARRAM